MEVTNFFVFIFFREVLHAETHFPGSCNGSNLATPSGILYPKVGDEMTPAGNSILGDSAFVCFLGAWVQKIVWKRKEKDITKSKAPVTIYFMTQRVLPSDLQRPQWGMRCFKHPFGILCLPHSSVAWHFNRLRKFMFTS